MSFKHENVVAKGTTVEYKVENTVPVGATALPASSELVPTPGNKSFTLTSETVAGLYTHKVTFGSKVVELKFEVVEPKAKIEVETQKVWDETIGDFVEYELRYGKDDGNATALNYVSGSTSPVSLVNGVYEVVKPFSSYGGATPALYGFDFYVIASNFAKLDFLNNQYSVAVSGPTSFSTTPNSLFTGIETLTGSTPNGALLTALNMQNFGGPTNETGGSPTTSHYIHINQFVDSGTPVGLYTFTITAGTTGTQVSKQVQVRVVAPTPKLDFVLSSYSSTVSSVERTQEVSQLGNTFTIEKPAVAGQTNTFKWFALLTNLQSRVLGTSDFAEVTADGLLTNLDQRKLFNEATGILEAGSFDYPAANLLVKRGLIKNLVRVTLKSGTATSVKVTYAETGSSFDVFMPDNQNTVFAANANTDNSTAGAFYNLTFAAGEEKVVDLAYLSTEVAGTLGNKLVFTFLTDSTNTLEIVGQGAAIDNPTFTVQISDFPDVIELGSGEAVNSQTYYEFVNVELDSRGPSSLIESFSKVRAAIILGSNKDGLVLFNQTGAQLTEAQVETTLNKNKLINLDLDANSADATGTYDVHDIYDAKGLIRNALTINNLTVEGNYTLKFSVGSLVQEYTIRIVAPKPKVFVLSNWVDLQDSDGYYNENVEMHEGSFGLSYDSRYELINFRNNNFLGTFTGANLLLINAATTLVRKGDVAYVTTATTGLDANSYYVYDGTPNDGATNESGVKTAANWDKVTSELLALTTNENYLKGTKAAISDLPLANADIKSGDVWFVTAENKYYRYNGLTSGTGGATANATAADWIAITPEEVNSKKFALPTNGVYNVEIPTTVTPSKDILYAEIAITDLPIGNYNYSVTRKFPDGRVEEFNDTIRIANVDANGKALLDPAAGTAALTAAQTAAKNLFINRWRIFETSIELGTYEYTFSIGGVTKKYTINVTEPVSFGVESLTINRKQLTSFNNKFRLVDTVLAPAIIGDVAAAVNLDNLVGDEYYVVYAVKNTGAKIALDGITLKSAYDAYSAAEKKTFLLDNLKAVTDTKALNLGEIVVNPTGGPHVAPFANVADLITYYVEFFRPVAKRLETDIGYQSVKVQTIEVKVADPAA
jgi:hypothetical protein